jgi:hypothetical protein
MKNHSQLNFLMIAFVTSYLTSEVILNRLVDIGFGFITGGTFIYFLSPMIADVITEVYGYCVARQVIWFGVIAWLFLGVCVQICLHLPYPPFWKASAQAYDDALGSLFRSCMVSSIAVLLGQLTNAYFISKLKIMTMGRYFWLRSVGSSLVGDTITVTLSIIGIFAGRIPAGTFTHTLIPEFIIMILFSACGAIPAAWIAAYLKKKLGQDHYDTNISYNPFKLSTETQQEI